LARALAPLGFRMVLATDAFCLKALEAGLRACGLEKQVHLVELPLAAEGTDALAYWSAFANVAGTPTHLVAVERAGPSHLLDSLRPPAGTASEALLAFL